MHTWNSPSILRDEGLLWAHPKLNTLLSSVPSEIRRQILNEEARSWIAEIYWLEGFAAEYAEIASRLDPDHQTAWLDVMRDEIRHQSLLGSWIAHTPHFPPMTPPGPLALALRDRMLALKTLTSPTEQAATIESTQILMEEIGLLLIRFRLPHIVDRDLRAVLIQIYKDEAQHLAEGRRAIERLQGTRPKPFETVRKTSANLFPLIAGQAFLSSPLLAQVKEASRAIMTEVIERAIEAPSPLWFSEASRFESVPGHTCFGCSSSHAHGIHLNPNPEDSWVVDRLPWSARFEGFSGIVHGGLIATAMDEIMAYAAILQENVLPLTTSLSLEYLKPVRSGTEYLLRAKVLSRDGTDLKIMAEVVRSTEDPTPFVRASGTFKAMRAPLAQRLMPRMADHPSVAPLLLP